MALPQVPRAWSPQVVPTPVLREAQSTGAVLRQIHPTPQSALLVGLRTNGHPYLLDLTRPSSGPVLVVGDPASGKTRQLQVMVDSALRMSLPHEIQVVVVSGRPAEWDGLFTSPSRSRHLLSLYGWYDPAAGDSFALLAQLAEDRRNGQKVGATVLLVLDDLSGVQVMDFEAQASLHSLLQEGPQASIWPLASLDTQQAALTPFWLDQFHTRLLSRIAEEGLADELSVYPNAPVSRLAPGAELCVHSEQGWATYRLPALGD